MQISKMQRYSHRVMQLGMRATLRVVNNRMQSIFFGWYWRERALRRQAAHSWADIAAVYGARGEKKDGLHRHNVYDFSLFWAATQQRSYRFLDDLYPVHAFNQKQLLDRADEYAQRIFSLLGSSKKTYAIMPWHTDVRLQEQDPAADCHFNAACFYKDMVITTGQSDQLCKDIKVPWELSRLQHIPVMAHAYAVTQDERYAQACMIQIADWLDHNPFLLGVNWVCPMEVGIRATNIVVAYAWLRSAPTISSAFWQRLTCALYDHLWYLEHHWELYDMRTSNHYLSDLIGYYYLCYFFADLPGIAEKAAWCQEELLREFNKQIFKEGMSYESSTSYHRLVTEIMYHFYLITTAKGITLPDTFMKGISRMLDAVAWCSYVYPKNTHAALSQDTQSIAHQIILVGDADSGTVLTGLPDHLFERMHVHYLIGAMHFPRFGLSLFKKDGWHMSLRHHAYHKSQPSSHVHNDAASMTLAIQGLPFIVDPGSFVYTPSSQWRNQFRSVTAHNSFFIQHHEPVPFDERLFALNVPEVSDAGMCDAHEMVATTSHDLYARFGLRAQRTLMFDAPNECMTISDWWHVRGHYQDGLTSCWHFTFAPEVTVHRHAEQGWLLKRGDVMIHCASAHLTFTVEDAWVSTQYGAKRLSKKLVAKSPVTPGKHVGIQFSRI